MYNTILSLQTKGNTFAFNMHHYSTFTFNVYHYSPLSLTSSANFHLMLKVKEKIDFLRFVKHSFNSNKTGGQILLSRTRCAVSQGFNIYHSHFYIKNYQKATICT